MFQDSSKIILIHLETNTPRLNCYRFYISVRTFAYNRSSKREHKEWTTFAYNDMATVLLCTATHIFNLPIITIKLKITYTNTRPYNPLATCHVVQATSGGLGLYFSHKKKNILSVQVNEDLKEFLRIEFVPSLL